MNKEELRDIYRRCDVSNNGTENPLGEDEFVALIDQYAYEYAERVITADELDMQSIEGGYLVDSGKRARNGLRAEQRNRNKELSSHREEEREI